MPGVRAVTEHAYVGRIERRSQVDKSPGVRQTFGTLLRIGLVQAGGAADAGDPKTARENIALRLSDAFRRKCRVRGQVEVALQSAQFDGGETVLPREVQNFLQIPGRAAQSGKRNRQTSGFPGGRKCGGHHRARESLREFSPRRSHGAAPPAIAGARLPMTCRSVKAQMRMAREKKLLKTSSPSGEFSSRPKSLSIPGICGDCCRSRGRPASVLSHQCVWRELRR